MTHTRYHAVAPNVGEVLAGRKTGKVRRTNQPVRRNSYHRGEREKRYWTRQDPDRLRATLEAARLHDMLGKKPGKRNGPLGHIALQVLDELIRIVDWKDGTLEPAIFTIMRRIRRSRDAVMRALAALKREGFLDWMRRTEPVEDAEGAGPRVRQISNAYKILTPASWARRIGDRVTQWQLRRQGSPAPAERPTPPDKPEDPALASRRSKSPKYTVDRPGSHWAEGTISGIFRSLPR